MLKSKLCEHLEASREEKSYKIESGSLCVQCEKEGTKWVHLRTCVSCGVTLCCDSSIGRHASRHAEETGHPVMKSAEPNEHWLYCYDHEQLWMVPDSLK